ncbi:type IV pilus biogenesis/stability protein PilW [Thalassotalea sp. HSM 43]|uniref:type IV pilus biogenesis/stability protein PilW n=1 Tax=Thalassotalea sp. HSM 43 TaxID=2552945 RepID=UPI0010816DE8|nr:type IV pilus biogenesis/stability protein PilW [Thalassotalea sp. HSM 43]QBY04982.1 type IV pilus biogenesis/stability protein PilW [Thalassotalea sp. HSM 43]
MSKRLHSAGQVALTLLSLSVFTGLGGCVTQNFADDTPVVEKDYSDNQLAKTRISLALGYLDMGNTAQAKYNLEKARQFSPDLVDVYTAFAHYYETVGEYEQTEESYLAALELAEDDANTLNNFGVFLCRRGRVEEAEVYFKQAIRVPTYIRVSETYENIALCYLKEPEFDKAEDALRRSILHSPNSASSLMQMAQLQYAKKDYEQAANFLSRFELATRRFTPQAIALSFKVQKNLGNDEIANNYATMLLNMFPESVESKQYLDNELSHISADDMAKDYKKYKLLKSGAKVNKKPIVVVNKNKQQQLPSDGLRTEKPKVDFSNNKLVDDATIAKQTGQSIDQNSLVANQASQAQTTAPVTAAKPKANNNAQLAQNSGATAAVTKPQPVSKPVTQAATPAVTPPTSAATVPAKPVKIRVADMASPVHVVQKGDNLYQISIKYNITISTLRRWNNLTNEEIQLGQVLRLTKPE